MRRLNKIGVLTSGGDAPGMNAAVRSVARYALSKGIEVYGIYEGYKGLIEGKGYIEKFNPRSVSNIVSHGGTMLYSARCLEFKQEEYMQKAVENCHAFGLDGIVTIGGDGTFRGASDLCRHGIPCIGIPGSIDNDTTASDYSIGYDTAVNTSIQMVDCLRDTCESHARCNVVEVMGRDAGYIALQTAIGVGATAVAVKERPFDEEDCIARILRAKAMGKRQFIVIVSEGADNPGGGSKDEIDPSKYAVKSYAERLASVIQERTGVETKFARLAHVVRGGNPSARDRVTAAKMGTKAVDLLEAGMENVFVCERNSEITYRSIAEAITIDRAYKATFTPGHKYRPEELEVYSPEKQEEIKEFVRMRTDEFSELLRIAESISSYADLTEKAD